MRLEIEDFDGEFTKNPEILEWKFRGMWVGTPREIAGWDGTSGTVVDETRDSLVRGRVLNAGGEILEFGGDFDPLGNPNFVLTGQNRSGVRQVGDLDFVALWSSP